jgi:hypothetical protein
VQASYKTHRIAFFNPYDGTNLPSSKHHMESTMKKETSLFRNNPADAIAKLLGGLLNLWVALMFFIVSPAAVSANFSIDQSGTVMTGLWWNQGEPGWGTAITHQYGMFFVTLYTYDSNHNPVWYVASNCPVAANGCAGTLYSVKGGTSLTVPWNGSNVAVTPAGTLNLTFTDANTGTMSYTINGVNGSTAIARNVFASGSTPTATDYSGLWWNASESGWGVALTRQSNMAFATLYTYDSNGNPKWYTASSCPIIDTGCKGSLYAVTGGSPLTATWSGPVLATEVGNLNLVFTDANAGTMTFTLNGKSSSKAITRSLFANPPAAATSACSSSATPAGQNYSQSGNNITVTTSGCIPLPVEGLCTASSAQATGINVLVVNSTSTAKFGGLTFNLQGAANPLDSLAATYTSTKTCLQNAPANLTALSINYNVCYDITSQLTSSLDVLKASGMVTVSPPVTVAAQGNSMMQTVADCRSTGADSISDAFTKEVWIKQANGSYLPALNNGL